MSLEQKAQLEEEMRSKVLNELRGDQALIDLIVFTLKNFAYRYIETKASGPIEPSVEEGKLFVARSFDTETMDILKATYGPSKKMLIEKAKAAGKQGIRADYEIGVRILEDNSAAGGDYLLYGQVSCEGETTRLEEVFEYEDILEVRNKLAKHLEVVCEVF